MINRSLVSVPTDEIIDEGSPTNIQVSKVLQFEGSQVDEISS